MITNKGYINEVYIDQNAPLFNFIIYRTGALYPDIADIRSIDLGYMCHYTLDYDDPSANIVSGDYFVALIVADILYSFISSCF